MGALAEEVLKNQTTWFPHLHPRDAVGRFVQSFRGAPRSAPDETAPAHQLERLRALGMRDEGDHLTGKIGRGRDGRSTHTATFGPRGWRIEPRSRPTSHSLAHAPALAVTAPEQLRTGSPGPLALDAFLLAVRQILRHEGLRPDPKFS